MTASKRRPRCRLTRLLLCSITFGLALATAAEARRGTGQASATTTLSTLKLIPTDSGLIAVLEGDGPLPYRVQEEDQPDHRLVLDLLNVRNPLRHYYPPETHPLLERILLYEYPGGGGAPLTRVVFELKQSMAHRIETVDDKLRVEFRSAGSQRSEEEGWSSGGGMGLASISEADLDQPASGNAPDGLSEVAEGLRPDGELSDLDPRFPPGINIEPADVDPAFFFLAELDDSNYRLGPEDVIEMGVFELDQLNRTVRVSGDGSIDLPLVGRLQVSGMTADEVSARIADNLRDRYVQNPQVTIFVKEFNSQRVSLLGAVNSPASYPLIGRRRLLQVLAEAKSLSSEAGNVLYIFRQTSDGRSARLAVPLNKLLVNGDPRWNVIVLPGDVVTVPPADAISVSILGAVNNPGVYRLPAGDEASLLTALAKAGGLSERASKKGIQIKRRRADGEESTVKVNLGDILSGKVPDFILEEGDVVIVKESFF